jgi:hypothetical protein
VRSITWIPESGRSPVISASGALSLAVVSNVRPIIQRISAVQEFYAERLGLVPTRRSSEDDSISAGAIDLLKSTALGACVGLGLFTAAWPSVAFRRNNVVVVYRYRYPDGEPVNQIVLAEPDCRP